MANPWWRDKAMIGGTIGIVLLASAFAWRWFRPEDGAMPVGIAPSPPETFAPGAAPASAVDLLAGTPAPGTSPVASPSPAAEEPVFDEATLAELSAEAREGYAQAMSNAEAAVLEGRLVDPPEDNALFWFQRALEIDPRNASATRGRDAVLDRVFESAHAALDGGDPAPAVAVLERFAAEPAAQGRREELAARLARQASVAEILRQGAQRLAAGQRFEPEGASALDSYRAALELDPRNRAAQQGLAEVERAVLTQALAAGSEDNFDDADRLLALAGSIAPGSQAQLETRTRIIELKRQRASGLLARAAAALDARNAGVAASLVERASTLGAPAGEIEPLRTRLANARLYDHHAPGERFTDAFVDRSGTTPEMVVLPIGEFRMGSPQSERGRRANEGPRHAVSIGRPFALARTETTVAQFRRFVRDTGYVTDAERKGTSSVYDEKSGRVVSQRGITWQNDYAGGPARDGEPVVHVSWNDATAYAAWLAERTGRRYRLPSEAEFEYALRGGTQTRYWWGDGNPTRVVANVTGEGERSRSKRTWTKAFPRYDDGYWGPAPAASFPPNPFGLHDLGGNVTEWVEDCWHDSYLRAPDDGGAWVNPGCERRVARGGSWGSPPDQIRSAYRASSPPDVRSARLGFRVARTLSDALSGEAAGDRPEDADAG